MPVCHTGLLLHTLLIGGVQGELQEMGGSVGGDSHESLVGGDHGDGQSLVSGGDMTETSEDFDLDPLDLDPLDLDPLDLPAMLDGGDSTGVDGLDPHDVDQDVGASILYSCSSPRRKGSWHVKVNGVNEKRNAL